MSQNTKTIQIQYFALLREERGLAREDYVTSANNARELFEELKGKYHFSLNADRLRVSINDEFADWKHSLQQNDSVVFIPPVAGG